MSARMPAWAATLVARLDALEAAPVATSRPRKGSAKVKPVTYHTAADVAAGAGFPCTADEPCSRTLKTRKRASIHGVDDGGHDAR